MCGSVQKRSEDRDGVSLGRREALLTVAGVGLCAMAPPLALSRQLAINNALPERIGNFRVPRTELLKAAWALSVSAQPRFLFNHCVRTFGFGAMLAARANVRFDTEELLVASLFHDLGLLGTYASKAQPFELDSADAAKRFLSKRGLADHKVEEIWQAIATHTSAISDRLGPTAEFLGDGAGADVFGTALDTLPKSDVAALVDSFPRFHFKAGFKALLVDYCVSKPRAQVGTWTDPFCRAHAPSPAYPDLAKRLRGAPFGD